MPPSARPEPPANGTIPLLAAADIQDGLLTAINDLDRLQALLMHACDGLLQSFQGATRQVRAHAENPDREATSLAFSASLMHHLTCAITSLQFQDMASQLIGHTHRRLRSCADRVAREAMGDDEDGPAVVADAPLLPNPVTQDEMDAGSVELF